MRIFGIFFIGISQKKVEPTPTPSKRGMMVKNIIYFTTLVLAKALQRYRFFLFETTDYIDYTEIPDRTIRE